MTRWADFEAADPELAALGRSRFEATHLALIGTIRPGGSPRISPIEPYLLEGELVVGVMRSAKADDLGRDPRCTIHSVVTQPNAAEPEFKVYGRVVEVTDPAILASEAGWWAGRPASECGVYAIDIEEAIGVMWDLALGRIRISRWSPSTGSRRRERSYP